MRKILILLITLFAASSAYASPTQTGATGLLTVPTADTLDGGNICVGIWGSYNKYKTEYLKPNSTTPKNTSLTIPVTLTLGVGSFWEFYAAYPNLLFNGEEDPSRLTNGNNDLERGRTADLGTKLRFWGKRASPFKMAIDFAAHRRISDDRSKDGLTDYGAKIIASLKKDRLGFHLYGGYLLPAKVTGKTYDNEILYGGGVEFSPTMRTKTTLEVVGNSSRDKSLKAPLEASVGFQYYLSPHFTVNLSGGMGLSDGSPDWKGLVGFSTCQGVGTYVKPVPKTGKEMDGRDKKKEEPVKKVKITPISSLLLKSLAPAPSSKLEVPVDPNTEEVVIKPYGQIPIQQQPAATKPAMPVVKEEKQLLVKEQEPPAPPIAQEVPLSKSEDEILTAPQLASANVAAAAAYTESRIMGVSPLYALEVKGEKVVAAEAKAAKVPEAMKVYRKFRFPDVTFEFGQWTLTAEGRKSLSEVAEQIRSDKKWVYLKVDGHTDNIGSVNYNIDLSLKRAIAVATYLVASEGIDPSLFFIKGMGKSSPIADNATSEGRQTNRRCEILLLIPKGAE